MVGDLSGNRTMRAIGLATHASPAPKVFTSQDGLESFSAKFFIDWTDSSDAVHSLEITPARYAGIQGPYNRRNAYGAALSYGPVLDANERTRPILHSVMNYAFCGSAPLLRELSIDPRLVRYPLRVRVEPRESAGGNAGYRTEFEVTCEEKSA
jgi:hypothetical protein